MHISPSIVKMKSNKKREKEIFYLSNNLRRNDLNNLPYQEQNVIEHYYI